MRRTYTLQVRWTGNRGAGTTRPRAYGRDHEVRAEGLPSILASADRPFHGDADRWNPELLLLAALAECHMLTYLFLATQRGIVVEAYEDAPEGVLEVHRDGSGEFTGVTLRPRVRIADPERSDEAMRLHDEVPNLCFIARSVSFPVRHEPTFR